MISMEQLENTIKVVQTMRKALDEIAKNGLTAEMGGCGYTGTNCAEIAQQALKDVDGVGK